MKTETRNKIEEALQAIAQLRADYPLDTSAFTRPDELEIYEIEVLNEGALYVERKAAVCWLIIKLAAYMEPEKTVMHVLWEATCALNDEFYKVNPCKNPRIGLHAALNHMEQQLREFLINGLYDELQEFFK